MGRARWLTPVIPALWEAEDHKVKRSRPSWPTWWNPISTKNTKVNQVWWRVSIIPATRQAEAEELLEPERERMQWVKIGHFTPAWVKEQNSTPPIKNNIRSKQKSLPPFSFLPLIKVSCRHWAWQSQYNLNTIIAERTTFCEEKGTHPAQVST